MNGRGIRYREDTGIEVQCTWCRDWWPLTREFWLFSASFSRCRACYREWQRVYQNRKYREDPRFAETKRAAARLTAWKDRQTKPGTIEARKAAYYQRHRDRILEAARRRYHEKKAA